MVRKINLQERLSNLRRNYVIPAVIGTAIVFVGMTAGVGYLLNRNLNSSRDAVLAELNNMQRTVGQYSAAVTGTLTVMNQGIGQRFGALDTHMQDNVSATQGLSRTVAQGFGGNDSRLQGLEGRVGRVAQGITDTQRMVTDTQGMVRQGDINTQEMVRRSGEAFTYSLSVMNQQFGRRFDALEATGREISGTVRAMSNTLDVVLHGITYTIPAIPVTQTEKMTSTTYLTQIVPVTAAAQLTQAVPVTSAAQLTASGRVTPTIVRSQEETSYSVPYLEARPVVRSNLEEIARILAQGETQTRNPDGGLVWGRYEVAHIAGGLAIFYNGANNDEEADHFTINDMNNTVAIELRTGRAVNFRNIPEVGIDRLRQIFGYN